MKSRGYPIRLKVVLRKSANRGALGTLSLARTVSYCLANHPSLFSSPPISLTLFNGDIKALDDAEAAAKTGPQHLYGTRDALLVLVSSDLDYLCAYVQWLVDRDRANGPAIAEKAGMAIAGPRARNTASLRLRESKKVSRGVEVVIRPTSSKEAHHVEFSLDGGNTYQKTESTLKAVVTLGPFAPGTLLTVRVSTTTKSGTGKPSNAVSMIVT